MISPTAWHSRQTPPPRRRGGGVGGVCGNLQQPLDLDLGRKFHPVRFAEPEEPLQ